MSEYYIAWNADKTEGYITKSKADAELAAGKRRKWPAIKSTLAWEFCAIYDEGKNSVQKVDIGP